ncbi:MAG: radical SAM protein [Lachnospiraceae bacterium]|nr:radical SAM protein [Lachnospiraceae bacterium]
MKQLKPPYPTIQALMRPQKADPSSSYRKTTNLLEVPCEKGVLWYQTLTGELILIEDGETWGDHEEELVKAWFLVPESYDELKTTREIQEVMRLTQPSDGTRTNFTILTTTDCNARCFYCYEMGRKRVPMEEKTAHDVAAYIRRVSCGKEVKLHWFGGEPLFCRQAIEIITEDLKNAGVSFRSTMTSNGYLFDEETVRKAKEEWNLSRVQITLDGTKEVYNRTKAYIYKDPDAYERVLNNIEQLSDSGITVSIRLNMNEKNAENLLELAKELGKRFSGRKNIHAYVAMIFTYTDGIRSFAGEASSRAYAIAVRERLSRYGLLKAGRLPDRIRLNHCMADDDQAVVIMTDGSLGKCEHYSDSEMFGSIYSDEYDDNQIQKWKERAKPIEACRKCSYAPRCFILRNCESGIAGCSDLDREMKIEDLSSSVLRFYSEL